MSTDNMFCGEGEELNICFVYSLEVSQWGTSNEYTQHIFSWKNMKK